MFWKMAIEPGDGETPAAYDGRFVLHRHRDAAGLHLDLRLEQDGYLAGWRIDGDALDGTPWATEKMPHPTRWLDHDGDADRVDRGAYVWLDRGETVRRVWLRGTHHDCVVRMDQVGGLPAIAVRDVMAAVADCNADARDAARLIRDGSTARQRAIARLCGLGRELDGDAFDEPVWRKALTELSLDEIHGQLRAFERRFDAAYPPAPVSQPAPLEGEAAGRDGALAILRDG